MEGLNADQISQDKCFVLQMKWSSHAGIFLAFFFYNSFPSDSEKKDSDRFWLKLQFTPTNFNCTCTTACLEVQTFQQHLCLSSANLTNTDAGSIGFVWQGFGSQGATGVTSSGKVPQASHIPARASASQFQDLPAAGQGQNHQWPSHGSTFGISSLRDAEEQLQPERGVRICGTALQKPSSEVGGDASGTRAEIPLLSREVKSAADCQCLILVRNKAP